MKKVCVQLICSSLGVILHLGTLLWYIIGTWYPGVFLVGIVSGITAMAETVLFLLSLRNYAGTGPRWQTILLTVLAAVSALFAGYCFLIWCLFFL